MTDTAKAPERIWAFHAGPMVGLFIGKKEVGTNVAEYVLATHCDELVAAAKAEGAREEREKWRKSTRDTFDAMCAMRDAINEYIPMPSLESDLLQGPENSVFCAAVAESVIEGAREAQAKIARLKEAMRPFSDMAGEMFARNWDASRVVIVLDNPEQINRVYVTDFFAARRAIGAEHASDCAVHNGPAYPLGSCTCGAALQEKARVEGRLVIVDSPELATLRADLAEAQEKIARLTMIANELSWSKKTRDISNRLFAALQENKNV